MSEAHRIDGIDVSPGALPVSDAGKYQADLEAASAASRAGRIGLLLVLAIIGTTFAVEFVFLLSAGRGLNERASQLAQMAAVGAAPQVLEEQMSQCRGGIDARYARCIIVHRSPGSTGGGPSSWRSLGLAAGANDAAPGDQIQVRLEYDHPLVLGGLLAPIFGASPEHAVALNAVAEAIRR